MSTPLLNDDVGILQEIFDQLPRSTRDHLLFNNALEFKKDPLGLSSATQELLSTITSLHFNSYHESFDHSKLFLLNHLPLTNLIHLDLSEMEMSEDSSFLALVAKCPLFENLESLSLSSCNLPTIEPLVRGPNIFPRLSTLDLNFNAGLDLTRLASSSSFPNLETLHVFEIHMNPEHAKILSESKSIPWKLEELSFSESGSPSNEGGKPTGSFLYFARSSFCTNLKRLTLSISCNSSVFADLVAEGLLGSLEVFNWSAFPYQQWCDPSPFLSSPLVSNLVEIDFNYFNHSISTSLEALTHSQHLPKLQRVKNFTVLSTPSPPNFPFNIISLIYYPSAPQSASMIDFIATAPCFSSLESIDLSGLRMEEVEDDDNSDLEERRNRALQQLFQSPNLSNLKRLRIISLGRRLLPETLTLLFTSPYLNNLEELNLEGQRTIGLSHLKLLSEQLLDPDNPKLGPKFGKLAKLNLAACDLPEGSGQVLTKLENLTTLDLEDNDSLTDDDFLALIALNPEFSTPSRPVLRLNNLTTLDCRTWRLSGATVRALAFSPILEQLHDANIDVSGADYQSVVALLKAPLGSNMHDIALHSWSETSETEFFKFSALHPYRIMCWY